MLAYRRPDSGISESFLLYRAFIAFLTLNTTTMPRLTLNPSDPDDIEVKGIVFDMDGTLCLPQTWMFAEMRRVLGIDKKTDILDHIYSLDVAEQEVAHEKVRQVERTAMVQIEPQPGLNELMDFLEEKKILKSICTRNFPTPVQHLLSTFLSSKVFHPIVTRDFKPPKPSPAGILHIAKHWNIDPKHLIMVGDSVDDMLAGYRAGTTTILLESDVNGHLKGAPETDYVVQRLDDIIKLLENGIEIQDRKPQVDEETVKALD
ncbi:HAD-like domain-containing protein [Myxozyma melibiosi]|uniref:HAD-like domain-containing protein n=1 Tax=Myxozyma melibiosi TaxID=54550 RepID=A0ABR1F6D9_9ASCO